MKYDLPERVRKDISIFARKYNISNVHSLLSFDVVEGDKGISEELKAEIDRDGVMIYEKT